MMQPDGWNVPILPVEPPATTMPPIIPSQELPSPRVIGNVTGVDPLQVQIDELKKQNATLQQQVNYLLANPSRGSSSGVKASVFYFEGTLIPGVIFGKYTFSSATSISGIEVSMREKTEGASATFEIYVNGVASGKTVVVADGSTYGYSVVSLSVTANSYVSLKCVTTGTTFPGAGALINVFYS